MGTLENNCKKPILSMQNFMRMFHEELGESSAYNIPIFYRLRKGVDVEKLRDSIALVISKHQAFRTILRKEGENVFQELTEEIKTPEIEHMSEAELAEAMEHMVMPYELYDNLLYRFRIIVTEQDSYLFCEMHHILSDGTSMHILLMEIQDAYNGGEIKEDDYFALVQNRMGDMKTAEYAEAKKYYAPKMQDRSQNFMPKFDVNCDGHEAGITTIGIEMSNDDLTAIKARYKLSATKFFIMCYLIALSRVTKNNRVGTMFTINGRHSELAKNVIGTLLYAYFVDLEIDPSDTFEDLAEKIIKGRKAVEKYRNFDCTALYTKESLYNFPVSNIIYQDKIRDFIDDIRELAVEEIELPSPYYKAAYHWEFEIMNLDSSMEIALYYNSSLFPDETAELMLETYRQVCLEVRDSL